MMHRVSKKRLDYFEKRFPKYVNAVRKAASKSDENNVYVDESVYLRIVKRNTPRARPRPTIGQAATLAEAAITGKYVSKEIVEARLAVCNRCDKKQGSGDGSWCGVCGCGVTAQERQITNLAAYEERLPKWGCHHPLRGKPKDPALPEGEKYGWPLTM